MQTDLKKNEEITFHDSLYQSRGMLRNIEDRFYDKDLYDDALIKYVTTQLGNISNRNLLFYGSGTDMKILLSFVSQGARVTAIDISEEATKIVKSLIRERKVENTSRVLLMDCEAMTFSPETFDIIFGRSIIHHLDINKAITEIYRVLKPGGKAIFIEPLGFNPLINLYRYLTPLARTKYEHPLRSSDISMLKSRFKAFYQKSFFLTSLFVIVLRAFFKNNNFLKKIFILSSKSDEVILRKFPFLGKYGWSTVITLIK